MCCYVRLRGLAFAAGGGCAEHSADTTEQDFSDDLGVIWGFCLSFLFPQGWGPIFVTDQEQQKTFRKGGVEFQSSNWNQYELRN
jgi:hypothetical protein